MRDSVRAGATVAILSRLNPSVVAGLGFLVSDRAIVTCAHVVKKALEESDTLQPSGPVLIQFVLLGDGSALLLADVAYWEYEPGTPGRDIAGLTIKGTPPQDAKPGLLSVVDDVSHFGAFGFPSRTVRSSGAWSEGDVRGIVAGGLLQLDSSDAAVHPVQPGFSGTAAWDMDSDTIVGMVVSASNAEARDAHIIPSHLLIRSWASELGGLALPPSPYRGLANFSVPDGHHFFGREATVRQIRSRLAGENLTVLVGPSGVGKTSIVYAGVLAQLQGEGRWRSASFRPGDQPLTNLTMAVLELEERTGTSTLPSRSEELRSSGRFFPSSDDLATGTKHLLFVDQLEELFADVLEEQLVSDFLDVVLRRLPDQRSLHVVLALRSDFYAALLDRPGMDVILAGAQVQVSPMARSDLRLAIEKPAALYNVHFEQGLVGHILDEAAGGRGALPLVEFALSQLWQYQRGGELRFEHLVQIGGVRGSVLHQADRAVAAMRTFGTPEATIDQALVRFFRRHEPTAPPTRRTVSRAELTSGQLDVVERLVAARLVSSDLTDTGDGVYELAHESVIQSWARLKDLAEIEGAFVLWRTSMESWLRNSYGNLPASLVEQGLAWLKNRSEGVTGSVRELILSSSRKLEIERKAQQEAEEAAVGNAELVQAMRAVQEAESAERTYQPDGVIAQHARRSLAIQHTAAAVAILRRALDSANLQARFTDLAESVRLVTVNEDFVLLRGAESSYKLMTHSGECFDLGIRGDARAGALSSGEGNLKTHALSQSRVLTSAGLQRPFVYVTYPDEAFGEMVDENATLALVGDNLVAISASSCAVVGLSMGGVGELTYTLDSDVGEAPQIETNSEWLVVYRATSGNQQLIAIQPAASYVAVLECPVVFEKIVVAEQAGLAFAWSTEGALVRVDLATGLWARPLHLSEIIDTVVSQDGSVAAVRARGGLVQVVYFAADVRVERFLAPDDPAVAMAIDNTGRWVATAHSDGHCNILDSAAGEVYSYIVYPRGSINDLAFSPTGSHLVIGGDVGPLVVVLTVGAINWRHKLPAVATSVKSVHGEVVLVATARTDVVCLDAGSGRVAWARTKDTALDRDQPESFPLDVGEADKVVPRSFKSFADSWTDELFIAIYADGAVELLTRSGELVRSVHAFASHVTSVVSLPAHGTVWVALRDRTVQCLEMVDDAEADVRAVLQGPSVTEVVAAGPDAVLTIEGNALRLWSYRGDLVGTAEVEGTQLQAVAASNDYVIIANDENILVLGSDFGELARKSQLEAPGRLAISPDQELLAVVQRDRISLMTLPNLAVRDEISDLDAVDLIAFARDTSELLIGGEGGIVWSIPLDLNVLLDRARTVEKELDGFLDPRVELRHVSSLVPLQLASYEDDSDFEEIYGIDDWNA